MNKDLKKERIIIQHTERGKGDFREVTAARKSEILPSKAEAGVGKCQVGFSVRRTKVWGITGDEMSSPRGEPDGGRVYQADQDLTIRSEGS